MKKPKKEAGRRCSVQRKSARPMPTDITIQRSSGRKEKFDKERLAITTSRSGVPFMMARDIAKKLTKQVRTESRGKSKKTVTGGRIRRAVGEELRIRNQTIATSYDGGSPKISGQGARPPQPGIGNPDTDQRIAYRADRDRVMHDKSKRLTSRR